jgi:flagellin-like hook-associated protein FlgL
MCDKITCLGKKQVLDDRKMKLFDSLSQITSVNFDNVNLYNDADLTDATENFINWIRKNSAVSSSDEVLDNIDSGIGLVEVKATALNQIVNIFLQMREIAILASTGTGTEHDVENYAEQMKDLFNSVQAIAATTRYNHTAPEGMGLKQTTGTGTDSNYGSSTGSYILPLAITAVGSGAPTSDTNATGAGQNKKLIPIQVTLQSGASFNTGIQVSGDDMRGSFMVHIYDLLNQNIAVDTQDSDLIEQDDYTVTTQFDRVPEMVQYIDKIDADILKLRNLIRRADSEYKSLGEYKTALLRYVKDSFSELDRKRITAKNEINDELCNILKTIGYLNVCIHHNGD